MLIYRPEFSSNHLVCCFRRLSRVSSTSLSLDLAPAGKDLLAVLGGGVGDTATRFELHTGGSDPIIFIGRFLVGKLQLPPLPGKDIPGLGVELRLLFIGNVGY